MVWPCPADRKLGLIGACLATPRRLRRQLERGRDGCTCWRHDLAHSQCVRPILEPQRKSGGHVLASFANVRRFIDTHLASPALETDMLARNFGLSRASLYRLFAPVGGVAGYIRRERLRRVFRDITAPEHANCGSPH